MLTAVAINVPPDLSPGIAQIAVDRCESAIGNRRCPLAAEADDSVLVRWYAVVRAEDGVPPRLQIDFREHSLSGPLLAQRTLFFSDRDAVQSRWASVGLIIAALVTETEELDALSMPSSMQVVASEQPTVVPRRSIPFGFDAGFVTGPGLQNGDYRVGAFGRGWIGLSAAAPKALLVAGFGYAERPGEASLTWLTLSLGVGIRIGKRRDPVNAEMTSVLLLERVLATAFDPSSGRSDSEGVTRFGGSIGADVAVTLWGDLRMLVGADVSALTPPVNIEVKGTSVGREPGLRFALLAGLRLDL